MKQYFRNRFYFRGSTSLGIVNTILACLFNIVFVKVLDDNDKFLRWKIDKGTNHPKAVD